jgi:sacsin
MSAPIEIPLGEAAGQNEPRWVRLRNLIDTYPKDSGILKELIQNADDGQAREVRIILDERNHDIPLARDDSWKLLCGPAIVAFNDQPFSEQDFTNLRNLANSAKIEDAFKTGRFGLGFNSVYNVTDFPILLTGEKLWCLDPCQTLLQRPEGGMFWQLRSLKGTPLEHIASLFDSVGYQPGGGHYPATAIRLPLRTHKHIQFNQDPDQPQGRARISATPFLADEFTDLVKGLSEIGHEILLFLKNVESICCERISESGQPETLLKIEITNAEQVRESRSQINEVLKKGLEHALTETSSAPNGALEATCEVSVLVTHQAGQSEQSEWLVSTGLFAGQNDSLIQLSRELQTHGERGLPHSGVAICLAKSKKLFPKLNGRVFCYLPIASNEYTGQLPVHVHGAFSLENSRTSLTSHRSDEHGKQRLLAQWNDLLMKEGVARAYASVLSKLTLLPSIKLPIEDRAKAIYALFPPSLDKLSAHHRTMVEQAVRELAICPIFLDVHSKWQPAKELLEFDEDADLEKCLATEGFIFAHPRVPLHVQTLLREVGHPLSLLTAAHIRDHFEIEEVLDCEVDEHPFDGLRSYEAIIAVASFLMRQKEDDWTGLPLGLTDDGRVHSLSSEEPLVIGTLRQREILSICPDRLASAKLNELWDGVDGDVPEGLSKAIPDVWLPLLAEHFEANGSPAPKLCPSDKKFPTTSWLKEVLDELNALPDEAEPEDKLIDSVPLVPDDSGTLHCPGNASTPLLLQLNEKSAGTFLDALGVRYRVLSPQNPLTKPLTVFRDKYELVWSLHPGDLIDSIHASLEELNREPRTWASRRIVEPLLETLERNWLREEMVEDEDRLAKLKVLPIFEDSAGSFGVVDDSCFSTGQDFTPPKSMGGLRLIRGGACPQVLKSLGVKAFSRRALLEQCLLPNYEDQVPEVRRDWLRWIRDEWHRLIGEFDDGSDALVDLLEEEELIQTENGHLVSATVCYHPTERSVLLPLIGDVAEFPDMSFYMDEQPLWYELFTRLGILRSPDTQHLADQIWALMEIVEEKGLNEQARTTLIGLAKHIFAHWRDHAQTQVDTSPGNSLPFGEVLRTECWLPAANGTELSHYLAAKDPEDRLFRPVELTPYAQGHLIASVCPLLPNALGMTSSEVLRALGIEYQISWVAVAKHFEHLLELAADDVLSEAALVDLKRPITQIYRFFGQLDVQTSHDDEPQPLAKRIAEHFAQLPCILVPEERRFFLPEDVYRTGSRGLRPIKQVAFSSDSAVDQGMAVLGRCPEPSIQDLAQTLRRLADEQTEPLADDLRLAVMRCLELLTDKVIEAGDESGGLPEVRVLNQAGYMVPPDTVFMLGDVGAHASLEVGEEEMLDQDTPQRVIQCWQIPHIRQAKVTPFEYSPAEASAFLGECESLQSQINHPQFHAGVARIVYHQTGTLPLSLDELNELIILPCRTLRCTHELTLGGVLRSLGRWEEDCCLHSADSGLRMLVNEGAFEEDVLFERVATSLADLVSETGLTDYASLVKILQCNPMAIARILTRLGVRPLPVSDTTEIEGQTIRSDDYFTPDAEDLDDEAHGEVSETVSADDEVEETVHSESSQTLDDEEDGDELDDEEVDEGEEEDEQTYVDAEDETAADSSEQGLSQKPRTGTGSSEGNSRPPRSGGSGTGVGRRNGNGRGARQPDTETTVRTHRRMLPGQGSGSPTSGSNTPPKFRQQDAIWISRPAPKRQEDPLKPAPTDPLNDEERPNHAIGRNAVGMVMAYERLQDRRPRSMAHANPGYDIESLKGRVVERYIEVKGIDGAWGANGVPLSPIQLKYAQEKGEQFWLYVVEHARDSKLARIHAIQNPAALINQYRFDKGWSNAACENFEVKDFPKPEEGRWLVILDDDGSVEKEGEIIDVTVNGSQLDLRVRFKPDIPFTSVIYNPRYMFVRSPK